MTAGLSFDEWNHAYAQDGRRLPSVTGLLKRFGVTSIAGIPEPVLEIARERGTAVHRAIHLSTTGTLDWSTVDPLLMGYLDAWWAWVDHVGYESDGAESALADTTLGFAGTADDWGRPTRGRYAGFRLVVDRKCTAQVLPEVGVQLAAYRHLLRVHDYPATHRIAVQLFPDGAFKEHEFRDPHDWTEFAACLTLHNRALSRAKREAGAA
jgi:hypothetical protein